MKKKPDQVSLSRLVFTHNWEDPLSDQLALRIQSNDVVQAITSGGCNVLGFLLHDPKKIYSVDINAAQNHLLELKVAAIYNLNYQQFISFAGIVKCEDRLRLYQLLRPSLTVEASKFWDLQVQVLKRGFIMNGKYERFVKLAGRFITLLQGRGRVKGFFEARDINEQQRYFDEVWNTKRYRYLFKLLFNKKMLARRGLVADYFTFDDGSTSFSESFYLRSKKAFRDIPIDGNYFICLYLLGHYKNQSQVPVYLQEASFNIIKSRLDRIEIITAGAQQWIDTIPDQSIDCFALSNICELMSEEETVHLFEAVARTASRGARVILRNLMIPREVPLGLQSIIQRDESLSRQLLEGDRSFVYGKVAAYNIHKS